MSRTGNKPECDHCGRRAKLRRAKLGDCRYCPKCWERFGGRTRRANTATTRRRAGLA